MVDIILSIYNGEIYLREQLDSIIRQSFKNWRLIIRDDGSKDNSLKILFEYQRLYTASKFIIITDNKGNIGLVDSINILLTKSTGDYIMFADQDDIWLENKIEESLRYLQNIERENVDLPIMICTDAKVYDSRTKTIIHDSFFKSQKYIKGVVGNKAKMLALNEIQGCTIIINKLSKKYIYPIPTFMRIHDMWIGVIIAHFGIVKYMYKSTLLYRQHNNNTLGSLSIDGKYYQKRFFKSYKVIKSLIKLKHVLPFKVCILQIIFYKIFFAFKRIMNYGL